MFVGRVEELNTLERFYEQEAFQMVIIYGRRRVGKTRLLQEFCRDHKAVYFCAVESSATRNLEQASEAIFKTFNAADMQLSPFATWHAVLKYLYQQSAQEKTIFVIDEYPYLAASEPEISSLLQSCIDEFLSNSNLMLILCGSSMSFMEQQVLGYQSPLYGRRTGQLLIRPLSYRDAAVFVPDYTMEEQAIVYGLTGGIPRYLELLNPRLPLRNNVVNLFLRPEGYLFEEPSNLLKQELREPASYNALIESVAAGATRLNEIAGAMKRDTAAVSGAIKTLISLGIVQRMTPVIDEGKRKTYYRLCDSMFLFWYRFVMPNLYLVNIGEAEYLFDKCIAPQLHNYMGYIFEDMCRSWLSVESRERRLPFIITQIGSWWGTDPRTHQQSEIDIVAINELESKAIFGECKFRNGLVGADVYYSLAYRAECLHNLQERHYALFSKSGFTQDVWEMSHKLPFLKLITLEDMYHSSPAGGQE